MFLLWGADLGLRPSWQMSAVSDPRKMWLAAGSLLTVWWRMPVPGAEIASCLPALAVTHLPLCLWRGEVGGPRTQPASSPLLLAQFRLEPFVGKFSLSFLSLSGCPTVWVAISR